MKKEIISITGTLGSGKSSTAKLVAEKLGYKHYSAGDFFRNIGLKLGISVNEVSKRAETDFEIDKMTDDEVRKVGRMDKIVIDSRLAFHFIPESFKVYLDLPPEIAKERILDNIKENSLRKQSEQSENADEIYKRIIQRLESERKRYKEYYGVIHTDTGNYDLIIDTNKNNLEEVVNIVIAKYKDWLEE
ncbi:MAG: AAA family ATPase [Candidatus Paceibacterota bacterium]|jgi:cytidylate kinase